MTIYKVKFRLYHYNSGSADNGYFVHEHECDTIDEAREFAINVKRLLLKENSDESHQFAEQYCWSGFLDRYIGMYEVIEKEIE